jgi:hypothetical protein
VKKLSLVLFCSLSLLQANGQAYKDEVSEQFLKYSDLILKKEFAKSLDYTNPGFLNIVPKEQMIKLMEATYNNPEIEFILDNPVILKVADSQVVNKESFVKLKYSSTIKMRFNRNQTDSLASEEQLKNSQQIKSALEKQFGLGNVKYDSTTKFYEIYAIKNVIANSTDGVRWTFLVVEERYKPILVKIIPKEIID